MDQQKQITTKTAPRPGVSRKARRRWLTIADYAFMSVLALFFLFPIVFMFASSFKPERFIFEDLQTVVLAFVPRGFSWENYGFVFERTPFLRYLFNSVFITVVTVGTGLFINSMIAYALSRLRWGGRSFVLAAVIALIIVPLEAISIPMLVVVNELPWVNLGGGLSLEVVQTWLDSYQVQIIPFIAYPFSIFLFYQFFLDIPKEFDEAAIVDGASPFGVYWRIVVPLARPAFATVAILHTLSIWSAYLWPLMTTRGETYRPLTVGITQLYLQDIDWGSIMAFASMATLPILVVYLLFQRWFIESVAASGVKG